MLTLPILIFVFHHYFIHSANLSPTGITNDENTLYLSYAHQYLDNNKNFVTYSNPFDGNPNSPAIYFQPVNLLFSLLVKLGIDPGLYFTFFGILMAFLCIYTGVKLLHLLLPKTKNINLIALLFTWGGGITAISGLLASYVYVSNSTLQWTDGIYIADPANGWWGLNWGRNLFMPLEAYYHFLFLICVLFTLKEKWVATLCTSLFLSISHPFTGIELLVILNGWLLIEKLIYRNSRIPFWFWTGIFIVTLFHIWYYLIYLNGFPEHKLLFNQYTLGWTYSLFIAIPAYSIVSFLAIANLSLNKPILKAFNFTQQRLFFSWAILAFLLSKHEWFIKPIQPIHFTRGYIWAGLFLFSLPAIINFISYFQKNRSLKWIFYISIFIFLSDNLLWTSNLLRGKNNVEWEGHITIETKQVLTFLSKNSTPNDLIIGNAKLVNYLANVYSKANSWVSHPYNTPEIEKRNLKMEHYFQTGEKPSEWQNRNLVLLLNKKDSLKILPSLEKRKIFENNSYVIFIP